MFTAGEYSIHTHVGIKRGGAWKINHNTLSITAMVLRSIRATERMQLCQSDGRCKNASMSCELFVWSLQVIESCQCVLQMSPAIGFLFRPRRQQGHLDMASSRPPFQGRDPGRGWRWRWRSFFHKSCACLALLLRGSNHRYLSSCE